MATKLAKKGRKRRKRAATGAGSGSDLEPFFRPFADLDTSARARKRGERAEVAAPPARARPEHETGDSGTRSKPSARRQPDRDGPSRPERERPAAAAPGAAFPETFAMYMAGVRALEARSHRIPKTASHLERAPGPQGQPAADPDAEARARFRSLVTEGLRFEVTDDGDRLEGRRLDTDPREVRRLRRGQYAVDGRIDLHGMNGGEARAAVESFVHKRRLDGDRVVLVVHGKGLHSPRGTGILRGEIGAWLSQGRAARDVAAFASAPNDEGGTGAVLVLLAR